MTLMEFLKERESTERIYIGTDKGAGWVKVCQAGSTIRRIDSFDKSLKASSEKTIKLAQQKLDFLPSKISSLQSKIKTLKEYNVMVGDELENELKAAEYDYFKAYSRRKNAQETLDSWTHVGDREVKDIYPKTTGKPGIAVIIDGNEIGRWFEGDKEN